MCVSSVQRTEDTAGATVGVRRLPGSVEVRLLNYVTSVTIALTLCPACIGPLKRPHGLLCLSKYRRWSVPGKDGPTAARAL